MSKKALIVYGTRFGATASTSEEIANVLRSEGLEVRVVNAKRKISVIYLNMTSLSSAAE